MINIAHWELLQDIPVSHCTGFDWRVRNWVTFDIYTSLHLFAEAAGAISGSLVFYKYVVEVLHFYQQMDTSLKNQIMCLLWICIFTTKRYLWILQPRKWTLESSMWFKNFSLDRHIYLAERHCHTQLKLDGWLKIGIKYYLLLERVPACWYIGKPFWVELKTCSNRNNGSTQAYRKETLNIVEDSTQDTSTCAWEYRLQLSSRLLCFTLEWTLLDILLTCFTA